MTPKRGVTLLEGLVMGLQCLGSVFTINCTSSSFLPTLIHLYSHHIWGEHLVGAGNSALAGKTRKTIALFTPGLFLD